MQRIDRPCTESLTVTGSELIHTVKQLIHEGNVRKVAVKQNGETIAQFPLTVGVIGVAIAPVFAAVGAIAALVADCTIRSSAKRPVAGLTW